MNNNRMGIWRALVGWIDQPKKTLRYVMEKPRWTLWLAPVLIIVLSLIVATVVSAPAMSELSREQAEQQMTAQMGGLSGEQEAQVQSTLETFTSPLFLAAMGIGMGTVGLILTWLFRGAVLFLIGYLFGTDNRYWQVVLLVVWSWLPFALRDLLQAVDVVLNGRLPINRGLSFLVASGDQVQNAGNLAYGLLAQVDPFLAWHLILVAVGLAVSTRCTRLQTVVGTVGYWALTALVGLAPTVLGMLTGAAL